MKQITELILFKSEDKTPYKLNHSSIFGKIVPSDSDKDLIQELSLLRFNYYFSTCCNLSFSYETIFGQEDNSPFDSSSCLFNYLIQGTISFDQSVFTADARLNFADFTSNRFKAIFKTSDNQYFILYADLLFDDINIENDLATAIKLEANEVKEKLYRIETFSLVPLNTQFINTDSEKNILLDSDNNIIVNIG